MFTIDPKPTFRATVPVPVPGQDAPASLVLVFRHLGKKALRAWIDGAKDKKDADFLGAVVVDWDAVQDAQGQDVAFNAAAFEQLLDSYATAGDAIFNAYLRELTEGRAKN